MSVALELRRAAQAAGRSAVFVATGQTGMMIEGWGVTVDRVAADFLQGTVEWLVEDGESRGDWVIVEGQGSLDHPAYSSVTLGLIHGATPHAMVMVHKPGMADHDFDHLPEARFPIAPLRPFIATHETVAGLVAPSKVVAVALNTSLIADDDEARRVIAATAAETGLPCDDPVRFGGDGAVARDRGGASTRCRGSSSRRRPTLRAPDGALPTRGTRARAPRRDLLDPAADARPAAARPVRDRARVARRGPRATTVRRRAPRRRRRPGRPGRPGRGLPGPVLRRDARDDRRPSCPGCSRRSSPSRPGSGATSPRRAPRSTTRRTGWPRPSPTTARPSAPSTSPSTTSSASGWACPIRDLLGIDGPIPPTDFTLGIDEPAVVAERARRAADFPALKVKVGGPADLETRPRGARGVRRPDPGRRQHRLVARRGRGDLLPELQRLGVELIEQPFPAAPPRRPARAPGAVAAAAGRRRERGDDRRPRRASSASSTGVNVKLAKCGGIGPARRMLERARELGFRTFLGCMEETSIGIAASAAVAPLADWVDLDGCLLLADDPVDGPGARRRQALAARRTRPAWACDGGVDGPLTSALPRRLRGRLRPQLCRRVAGPVHRSVAGCGQVGRQHGGEAPTDAPAQGLRCADRR